MRKLKREPTPEEIKKVRNCGFMDAAGDYSDVIPDAYEKDDALAERDDGGKSCVTADATNSWWL